MDQIIHRDITSVLMPILEAGYVVEMRHEPYGNFIVIRVWKGFPYPKNYIIKLTAEFTEIGRDQTIMLALIEAKQKLGI